MLYMLDCLGPISQHVWCIGRTDNHAACLMWCSQPESELPVSNMPQKHVFPRNSSLDRSPQTLTEINQNKRCNDVSECFCPHFFIQNFCSFCSFCLLKLLHKPLPMLIPRLPRLFTTSSLLVAFYLKVFRDFLSQLGGFANKIVCFWCLLISV